MCLLPAQVLFNLAQKGSILCNGKIPNSYSQNVFFNKYSPSTFELIICLFTFYYTVVS